MRKKIILPLIISICLLCGGCVFHSHTFSEEWNFDEVYHWHDATCGHDVKNNLTRHSFDSTNRCTVCGYKGEEKFTQGLHFEPDPATQSYIVESGSAIAVEIVIPSSFNGRPVTKIADNTFAGHVITAVIIPESIVEIGEYAFFNCSSLVNIDIPSSVTKIGKEAFAGCRSLTEIVFSVCDGWIVNGEEIPAADLADPTKAAELLKSKTDEWLRA